SATRLITSVPSAATTGPITVTTPLGSAVSPRPFRVIGAVAIAPPTATVGVGGSLQFIALEDGVATTGVIWAVNGVVGGHPATGPISPQGLYTAPAAIGPLQQVTIAATSRDDVSVVATAVVTLRAPIPMFLAVLPVGVLVREPGLRTFVAQSVGV